MAVELMVSSTHLVTDTNADSLHGPTLVVGKPRVPLVTISELETVQTSSTQDGSITGFSLILATLYFWLRA